MRPAVILVSVAGWSAIAAVATAAPVRPLPLAEAEHRVLDRAVTGDAQIATSPAGDLALMWPARTQTFVATRAAGGRFRGPIALPGALEATNQTLDGPTIGVGGGTLVTWRAGGMEPDYGALRIAASDPGQPVTVRPPFATAPATFELARAADYRTAVAPDGTAAMAVARAGVVRVTQRAPGANFGPEVAASPPGETVDPMSVRLSQDDGGGLTVTWTAILPCIAIPAPRCEVNRVATRARGGAFGAPRSLAETPDTGYPAQLQQPFAVADGSGRTVLAWRRVDPGRFDGYEVSVGSATRGYGRSVALPGVWTGTPVTGRPCRSSVGTPELLGALPARAGATTVLVARISGCGSLLDAYPVSAAGVASPARTLVAGVGSRAMVLLQRSRRTVLLVQSRNTIRAAFARGGAFPRLRTVGPRTVQRFGPSILLDDGRLLVEYGRGCAAGRGANSEIAVLAARSPSQLVRRMHGCGTTAPLAIDDGGAVVTLSLAGSTEAGGTLTASVSCPFVAALAAQRARRRSTCR